MPTTITATPIPSEGVISLVVTTTAATGRLSGLTRTDINGTAPVRLLTGENIASGVLVHRDAEAALTGQVVYTVRTVDAPRPPWNLETATVRVDVTGTFDRAYICPPFMPAAAVELDPVGIDRYEAQRMSTATVHEVIDRPDPLVTQGPMRTRAGRLTVWCADYAQARLLEASYGHGEIMLLRQPDYPGLDMYHHATRTTLEPRADATRVRRWALEVDYVELARPLGPLLGLASWTLADSAARNPTLEASLAEFPTLLDLALGPHA